VEVKIDVPWRHPALAEVYDGNSSGNPPPALSGNFEDASLLHEQERMLDGIRRSPKPFCAKSQHINVLIVANNQLSS
jgi:hypothetical protein